MADGERLVGMFTSEDLKRLLDCDGSGIGSTALSLVLKDVLNFPFGVRLGTCASADAEPHATTWIEIVADRKL